MITGAKKQYQPSATSHRRRNSEKNDAGENESGGGRWLRCDSASQVIQTEKTNKPGYTPHQHGYTKWNTCIKNAALFRYTVGLLGSALTASSNKSSSAGPWEASPILTAIEYFSSACVRTTSRKNVTKTHERPPFV